MNTNGLRTTTALIRRAFNEILRVPGAAIPGVLAPAIFLLGLTSVFGETANLPGFPAKNFQTFIIAVGMLQGAGFTGAATGVNLARDIEQGWFDRLLLCPAPRISILAGIIGSAALRSLIPVSFLFAIGLIIGVQWPGIDGLFIALICVMGLAMSAACWGVLVALRFRTQQAAPLMQVVTFASILFTTAYAPKQLLAGWMETVATINPVTHILEGVRQGFIGPVTWSLTWPALLALAGLLTVLGGLALRRMQHG